MTRLMRSVAHRRDNRSDGGFTLTELLVAMLLLGVVMAVAASMVIQSSKSERRTNSEQADEQALRISLDASTKELGAATPITTTPASNAFVSASPYDTTFYSSVDTDTGDVTSTGPQQVRLYVDWTADTFDESITPATGSGPYTYDPSQTSTRVLARHVVDPQPTRSDTSATYAHGGPVFVYFGQNDTTRSSLAQDSSGNLTSVSVAQVYGVEVWLTVRSDAADAPATTLTGRVTLPNVSDPDGPAQSGS